jgi:hypothetical protein
MNSFAVPERTLIQLGTNGQMTNEFYCVCLAYWISQTRESLISANIWNMKTADWFTVDLLWHVSKFGYPNLILPVLYSCATF